MIEYTPETLWDAVCSAYPSWKIARDAGVNFNVPGCCHDAAAHFFTFGVTAEQEQHAAIIRQALQDLHSIGQFNYWAKD